MSVKKHFEKTSTNTWLKRMLEEYDDLKLHLFQVEIEFDRYQRLHNEYIKYGREYLIQRYNHNLTYVYKYLNTDIYQRSRTNYIFVRQKMEKLRRVLNLISYFHPDLFPEDFESEAEKKLRI